MDQIVENRIKELQKLLVFNRIKILQELSKEDLCVCKLVDRLNMKHNLLSHHLKTLLEMGYLTSSRNGQHIIYGLIDNKKDNINKLLLFIN